MTWDGIAHISIPDQLYVYPRTLRDDQDDHRPSWTLPFAAYALQSHAGN